MIERFVDVASIRSGALLNGPRWDSICEVVDANGELDHSAASGIIQSLIALGVNALPLLMLETVQAIAAKLPRSTYQPALLAIRHEFGLLAKCEIHPTLYMHQIALTMATARGLEPPSAACFYLPVIPQLAGDGDGGPEFLEATQAHISNFNRETLRFLKGDKSAIQDIRTSVIAIKNRRPKAPYFTPISLGAAFLAALADKTLPLSTANMMLFSRITAVIKAAMADVPLLDHTVSSRLAYAIAHSVGAQKRVELMINRLELHRLLSTNPPEISEFPPADMFVAAFNEASDAWKVYMAKGLGKRELTQAVDLLRIISGSNPDLKKLANAFSMLAGAVTSKRYEQAQVLFDHVTQFMARYFDAVATRDPDIVARTAAEEWESAQAIEDTGFIAAERNADTAAHVDVAREAAIDVVAAREAFERNELLRARALLEITHAVLPFIGLIQAGAAADLLIQNMIPETSAEARPGILAAFDCLGRYLEIVYVRPDTAPMLLADIAKLHLKRLRKSATIEATSDREMFDIFWEEANEVIESLLQITGGGEPIATAKDVAVARRGFHTLKGGANIVGLEKLGALMAEIESIFEHWMASTPPYPRELSALADSAARFALALCETIASSAEAEFNPVAVVEAIEHLRRSEKAR